MITFNDIKIELTKPMVAKSLFFCTLAFVIIQLLFFLFSSHELLVNNASKPNAYKKINTHSQMINALKTPFFGTYLPKNLNEFNVKQSMLNLTVVGIMYAPNDEDSLVIIQSSTGKELTYRVGDKIPGGAVIKKIMPDGVFVERDGILESLSLPKMPLIFAPNEPLLREL